MPADSQKQIRIVDADSPVIISNTVALIGMILACLAILLLAVLFFVAGQLPDDVSSFQDKLSSDTPAQLRILILGCSIAVLTLVSFALCVVGLFLPQRPRLLAAAGAVLSFLMLAGVFGVLFIGAFLNPEPPVPKPAESATPTADSPQQ